MANVNVDYAQLEISANQLSTAHDEIAGKLTQLQNMINNLVASGFTTDQASVKFQTSYEQWTTGAKNVVEGLTGMTSFLRTTIERHRALDTELGQSAGA